MSIRLASCRCGHRCATPRATATDAPRWRADDGPALLGWLLARRPELAGLAAVGARVAAGFAEGA